MDRWFATKIFGKTSCQEALANNFALGKLTFDQLKTLLINLPKWGRKLIGSTMPLSGTKPKENLWLQMLLKRYKITNTLMKLEKQSTLCQETEEAVLNVKNGSNTSLQVKRDFMR